MHKTSTKINLFQPKAQTLIELATFGTIALLCLGVLIRYGMNAIHSQAMSMETFHEATAGALHEGLNVSPQDVASGDANGRPSQINLIKIQDRIMPSPDSKLGLGQRSPASGSAGLMLTQDMYGQYDYKKNDLPSLDVSTLNEELPHFYINLNNQSYSQNIGDSSSTPLFTLGYDPYTSAKFKKIDVDPHMAKNQTVPAQGLIDFDDDGLYTGIDWETYTGQMPEQSKPGQCWKIDHKKWIDVAKAGGGAYDIDGDGKWEALVGAGSGSGFAPIEITGFGTYLFLDYNEGDVDQTYDSSDFAAGNPRQGLAQDSNVTVEENSTLNIDRGNETIDASTTSTAQRKIITRQKEITYPPSGETGVTTQKNETWSTPLPPRLR